MARTIAVFGAGRGLGASVARRFGREGYQVALVARRRAPLDTLVEELAGEGIEAAAFPADLARPADMAAVVTAIRERFGRIDVVEYAPVSVTAPTSAKDLDVQALQHLVDLYLLTPVEIVRAVLPEMLGRGEGGVLIGQGYPAVQARPNLSGPGPVWAATRNYVHSLHGEVAGAGVYVGTLAVRAIVERSAAHEAITSGNAPVKLPPGVTLPVVDPDDLAEQYWDMLTHRDSIERIYPAPEGATPA